MPLGNTDALRAWAGQENPPYRAWHLVEQWVLGLANAPWQAPSVPMLLSAGDPWETRVAEIPGLDVVVIYEHEHESGLVNLLYVGR